ncbi:unnamed protein product, partial [Didymodactylos carnosus]
DHEHHIERENTRLSDDFHLDEYKDQQENFKNDDEDNDEMMADDKSMDKAATTIQATYRGYKIRKELVTGEKPGSEQQKEGGQQEYEQERNKNILSPSAEGNKLQTGEDAAAAVVIQAAYRGYRVRKDLDK